MAFKDEGKPIIQNAKEQNLFLTFIRAGLLGSTLKEGENWIIKLANETKSTFLNHVRVALFSSGLRFLHISCFEEKGNEEPI